MVTQKKYFGESYSRLRTYFRHYELLYRSSLFRDKTGREGRDWAGVASLIILFIPSGDLRTTGDGRRAGRMLTCFPTFGKYPIL